MWYIHASVAHVLMYCYHVVLPLYCMLLYDYVMCFLIIVCFTLCLYHDTMLTCHTRMLHYNMPCRCTYPIIPSCSYLYFYYYCYSYAYTLHACSHVAYIYYLLMVILLWCTCYVVEMHIEIETSMIMVVGCYVWLPVHVW